MEEFLDYFKDKKNILNVLIFAILIMMLPLGVNYVRRQQIIKSRAAGEPIVFTGANIDQRNGIFVALKSQISLDITAPLPPTGSRAARTADSKAPFINFLSEGLVGTVYAGHCERGDPNSTNTYCESSTSTIFQDGPNCTHIDTGTPCGTTSTPCECVNGYWQGSLCDSWQSGSCGSTSTPCECVNGYWQGSLCDSWQSGSCGSTSDSGNYCLGKGWVECSPGTVIPGGCPLNGKTCTKYAAGYQCNYGGKNYCDGSFGCAEPCSGGSTTPTQPGSGTTPTGSAGTDWYGCSAWNSDCTDKTKTCITSDGKAGVVCKITCTACGTKGSEWYKKGACGGHTSDYPSGPYCSPDGSGASVGGSISGCTWTTCTGGASNPGAPACTFPVSLTSDCTNCILKVKNSGGGDLYNTIKQMSADLGACTFEQIVSHWCTNLSSQATAECAAIKAGACSVPSAGTATSPASKNCSGTSAPAPTSGAGGPAPTGGAPAPTSGAGGPAPTSGGGGPAPSSPGGGSNPPPNPPPPPVTTVSFRLADNPSDLATAPEQLYIADPTAAEFEFKDKNPGQKFVWVEFKFSDGTTERHNKQIKLLGPDPQVVSCALSFEGNNTILNLTGQNFGSQKGIINSNDTNLQVKEWKNGSIKAVWPNAPEGEQLPVALTNPDQQKGEGQCSAISRLALGAKVFCRAPSNHNTNNVDLVLAGAFDGGAKARQKVSIDSEGVIQGLTQKLEEGKQYNLSIKAPDGIRKSTTFTAGSGTTNIPNFILPIGDIFPSDGGDGKINTLDKAELNRQWIVAQPATSRSGDFNQDDRVNSIDWACMRFDFGVSDDPEAVAGAPTTVDVTAPALTNTDTTTNTSSSSSPNPSATSTTSPNPSASSDQTSTQTSTQSLIVSPVPTATSTINSPSKGKGKNKFFLQ